MLKHENWLRKLTKLGGFLPPRLSALLTIYQSAGKLPKLKNLIEMLGVGGMPSAMRGTRKMGERLKRIIAKQEQIREEMQGISENQAWQQDYESAEINQFAESCLPQRPLVNLNHINIEWESDE
jgi:hypothetical protein